MLKFIVSLLVLVFTKSDNLFLDENQESGFIPLSDQDDIFYWLFRSRSEPSTDPLLVWLTGGPGCASELAIFYENGPFSINEDISLKKNDFSWNNQANVIYID